MKLILGLTLLALLASSALATETFSVLSPSELSSSMANPIPVAPAMFGSPVYGSQLVGQIIYHAPADNPFSCDPIKTSETTPAWPRMDPNNPSRQPNLVILMVDRGNCTYVQKVRNAENAGAAAVLVVDNTNSPFLSYMADDGTGIHISLPSMITTTAQGAIIKQFLTTPANAGKAILVSMRWTLPNPDNVVELDLWTSVNDQSSKPFKQTFMEATAAFGSDMTFTPHYQIMDGRYTCHIVDGNCGNFCTNQGRYCARDPDGDPTRGAAGADVVTENLWQMCVFQVANRTRNIKLWFMYVNTYDNDCTLGDRGCSSQTATKVGLDASQVQACVDASANADGTNRLMDAELQDQLDWGIWFLPWMTINRMPYRGGLTCAYPVDSAHCPVVTAICSGYAHGTEPAACHGDTGCSIGVKRDSCGICGGTNDCLKDNSKSSGLSAGGVVGIVFGVTAVVGICVLLYVRRQRNTMRGEIDDLIRQYLPLADDGHAATANSTRDGDDEAPIAMTRPKQPARAPPRADQERLMAGEDSSDQL